MAATLFTTTNTTRAAALISTSLIYYTTVAVTQLCVYLLLDGIRRVGDVLLYLGGDVARLYAVYCGIVMEKRKKYI